MVLILENSTSKSEETRKSDYSLDPVRKRNARHNILWLQSQSLGLKAIHLLHLVNVKPL